VVTGKSCIKTLWSVDHNVALNLPDDCGDFALSLLGSCHIAGGRRRRIEVTMSEIMIRCPETGNEISTGIHCDRNSFGQLPFIVTQANCPLCGKPHSWSKAEAWLGEDPARTSPVASSA